MTPSISVVSTLPLYFFMLISYLRGRDVHAAVVWSANKQMAIIDSLFHNYYVPPVVFAISKDPVDGYETRLCVDGKQRLTSIQKFFDGQVCLVIYRVAQYLTRAPRPRDHR